MERHIQTLLDLAGPALGSAVDSPDLSGLPEGLRAIYLTRNGFYAFESALHCFPAGSPPGCIGLTAWNDEKSWRHCYGDMTLGCFFFAEDLFGGQFCVRDGVVQTFDPETGRLSKLANSVEEWAKLILDDYQELTGFSLARAWQARHGPLATGHRLVPRIPFVLGGEYDVANLRALEATAGMRFRGEIATQIRDLPDGAEVRFEIVE